MELFWAPAARHFFQALNHFCGSFLPPFQLFTVRPDEGDPVLPAGPGGAAAPGPLGPRRRWQLPPGPRMRRSGSQTGPVTALRSSEYFLAVSSSSAFVTYKEEKGKKKKKPDAFQAAAPAQPG